MTTEEKDRLEIVKEVCGLQDCTLQEIYNFVKTGKTDTAVALDLTPADGVYLVTRDGRADKFTGTNIILDSDNPVIGIGVKQGDRGVIIALKDVAGGGNVTLTKRLGTTDDGSYIPEPIDAVADWNGKANTDHLREIGLNPAIALNDDQYIPSVGEMYLIYTHRREINAALRHVGGMEIPDEWYLTSTALNATCTWTLHLSGGNLYWDAKTRGEARVRLVSAFNFNR